MGNSLCLKTGSFTFCISFVSWPVYTTRPSTCGVFRTRDGGRSWQRVLFRDPETGASDVALDPTNPRILFAGLWQARRTPWSLTSGGDGSGGTQLRGRGI